MAFLFQKFQEAVKVLAKSPMFARDPRHIQFEADMNRLFLYTSYNRLGRDAEEADADEIIDMANKAPLADQQKQVQENIHSQIKTFCTSMNEILLPHCLTNNNDDVSIQNTPLSTNGAPHRSGLSFAIGRTTVPANSPAVLKTRPLNPTKVSQSLKDRLGYTLDIRPSQIPHKDAGNGLFIDGEAGIGAVIAIYPGVIYSPAYYRYIPGYPRVNVQNPYLITRYDGLVINAQPWGAGGESREVWAGLGVPEARRNLREEKGSDRFWKMLSKPVEGPQPGSIANDVLERRNPLALAHFANHPAKDTEPNVMVCPYDFPLTERDMRPYIPNVLFGRKKYVKMRRFGSFWFKSGRSSDESGSDCTVLKTIVLVATRALCHEEVLLNYRLSNSKSRPEWYTPVDEEEDRRRWS